MTTRLRADSTLLERTARGDRGAWEELRGRYTLSVYAQVFGLVGDPSETEDVVEETFQRAWCSAGQFAMSEDINAGAWLVGLARSVLLARARRHSFPDATDPRAAPTLTPASALAPGARVRVS